MANILIGYGNAVELSTLGGGSWNASYPLNNLKDPRLALTARTSNALAASSIITADLGTARRIRVVGLVNHNLSAAATLTVEGSTASNFSPVGVTSGAVPAWPVGTVAAAMTYPRPTVGVAVDGTYRYWRISVTDTSNSAGYIRLGRLFIGEGFRPSINMQGGAGLGLETDTTFEKSLSGAEFASARPLRRTMRFSLPPLPNSEAFGEAFEVNRRSGTDKEVFIIADADDTTNRARRDFMGRLRALSPVEQPFGLYGTISFEVAELL
jgi:hypothetical protein